MARADQCGGAGSELEEIFILDVMWGGMLDVDYILAQMCALLIASIVIHMYSWNFDYAFAL